MKLRLKITSDDCQSCGACCVAAGDGSDVLHYGYADLSSADFDKLSPYVRRKIHTNFVGGELRHRTQAKPLPAGGAACQHLRGTPGERCSCTIYATRPEICAKFRVGSQRCHEARASLALHTSER